MTSCINYIYNYSVAPVPHIDVDPYFLLTYGVPLASAIICLCAMCLPCCVACCLYAKKTGRSERNVADHLTSTGIGERLVDQSKK